ncbi:MAG: sporulation protein YqfD, partial [Clostridia bacterium]|nr:sporulation protein YqfD [Clostridia bacterium]
MDWMRIWRWARGWVRFEAEGGTAGRLLTLAAREGVPIWDTHREGAVLTASCLAADYPSLRPLRRRCGLRLRLKERHGAAFVMRRYHARPGLLAGVAVYMALLLFLSGRIWSLDMRGLETADEGALRGLLAEHGVTVGGAKARVDSEAIRLDALTRLTDISWLAVNLDGCVAEIEVREMNRSETPTESTAPSNLVAARDGIVLSVEVTGGTATVQVGDAVAEGGMLASGIIVTERETLFRRSSGRVMAQTSREITVQVPLAETLLLPTGKPTETLEVHLFGFLLPLSDNGISPTDCQV